MTQSSLSVPTLQKESCRELAHQSTSEGQTCHDDMDWLRTHVDQWLNVHNRRLVELRRHLHANPEPSGMEFETAEMVFRQLHAAGLEPRLLPKKNGVLCDLGIGRTAVALRADMDALLLPDLKETPYRSTVDNVCHACGHDVHTAILVGVALALAEVRSQLPGRIRLVFQPAEEILPCGSIEVIDAGGLDGVSEIFGLHCDPRLPAGQVGLRVGPLTAAADNVTIRVSGPGGHTARPHLSVDIVHALGRVVTDVPALLARRVDARSGLLLVFGLMQAGTVSNAIPTEGIVAGTVRMLDREIWELTPKLMTQVLQEVVAPTGAIVELEYLRGRPPVVNAERSIRAFTAAAMAALGPDSVASTQQSMGGEDFSWYLEQVPGAMARLGTAKFGEELDLHQGTFDVDERAIGVGVRLLANTAVRALTDTRTQ